jgi:hypothetical protein
MAAGRETTIRRLAIASIVGQLIWVAALAAGLLYVNRRDATARQAELA